MKSMRMWLFGMLFLVTGPVMAFSIGERVECNWKGGGKYYPGRIADKEGPKLFIQYDDGDREYTTASMCQPLTGSSGDMVEGSRVSCRWRNGSAWYPGVIVRKTGQHVFVHYSDGDKEDTTLSKCRPR